jgi:hypothetical protein
MENFLEKKYFKRWIEEVSFRRYDRWCETDAAKKMFDEIKEEEEDDRNYAMHNNMDSIYWCWNCKYGECEEHF